MVRPTNACLEYGFEEVFAQVTHAQDREKREREKNGVPEPRCKASHTRCKLLCLMRAVVMWEYATKKIRNYKSQ